MSADAASADLWVADLEDILGLSPEGRQERGADRKRAGGPARARLIYLTVVVVGLSTVALSIAHTYSSSSIGSQSPDRGPPPRTQPSLVRLDPSGMTASTDTLLAPRTRRDAGSGAMSVIETAERSPIRGREPAGPRWREAHSRSAQAVKRALRAGNYLNAGGETVASFTAGVIGRGIAATADPASPGLASSGGTSLPDLSIAGGDARLVSAPPPPLRPFSTPGGAPGQSDKMAADRAGMTSPPAVPEKTSVKKAGAIDALRMLRRQ